MKRNDFEFLLSLLTRNVGWNFSEDDYYVIDKKISNFIREHNYASVEELMAELRLGQKNLTWQVIEALAMSDTHFYRDYVVFRRFEEFVLPSLREANRGHLARSPSRGNSFSSQEQRLSPGASSRPQNRQISLAGRPCLVIPVTSKHPLHEPV